MSVDLSLAVLTSVVAKLNAAAPLAVLVSDRIYDIVPEDVEYPYISLPPMDSDTNRFKGGFGQNHLVPLDIWSRDVGQTEIRSIAAALYDIFETITGSGNTGNHSGLTVVGGTVSICQIINNRVMLSEDKKTLHGIIELSIRTRSN